MIWFTADTHFRHANIIRYCKRPLGYVDEMDESMIARINECVRPDDTLYHLGDFSLRGVDVAKLRPRINCQNIIVVLGNHDPRGPDGGPKAAFAAHFTQVASLLRLKVDVGGTKQVIVLCHYAMRVWERSGHGSWHLYGHSHGRLPPLPRSMDVGVDAHDFRPINIYEVAATLRQPASQPADRPPD